MILRSSDRDGTDGDLSPELENDLRRIAREEIYAAHDRGFGDGDNGGGSGWNSLPIVVLSGALLGVAYLLRSRPEAVGSAVGTVSERVDETTAGTSEWTEETAKGAAGRVREGGQQVSERAEETADAMEEGGEEVSERVDEAGSEAARTIEETGSEAAELDEDETDAE